MAVHFNVTAHPTARWTTQQIVEAFPYDEAPRFIIPDRDASTAWTSANAPIPRDVEPSELGKVIAIPQVGGLPASAAA